MAALASFFGFGSSTTGAAETATATFGLTGSGATTAACDGKQRRLQHITHGDNRCDRGYWSRGLGCRSNSNGSGSGRRDGR